MWTKLSLVHATRMLGIGLIAVLLASPAGVFAQEAGEGEDDLGEDADEPASGPGTLPAEPPEEEAPRQAGPELPPKPVALPPVPALPPSPFTLTVKGVISGSMFLQDLPARSGNGGGFIFGGINLTTDKWFLGGDVRQSQLLFSVRGPQVLGGALPNGVIEFDLLGGNQIATVPGALVVVPVRDAMMMPIGSAVVSSFTSSPQGDESVLPRVRLAYAELNWGMGEDVLRIGQFHNLLLPMIAASGSHIGTPLGYGAGQLGWRAPGITYLHKFMLSETTSLTAGLQVNRNSWIDNVPVCAPMQIPGPTPNNCVPSGVSLGEASTLPQVEARVVVSGPPAPSPFPMYAPNAWQVHLVGHWDQKDLSGVGAGPAAGMTDTLTTFVAEAGFKVTFGPVLLAGNGWYGQNAGGLFGHIVQMQAPGLPDVTGFGAWGQLGFSFTKNLSLWGFGGIDKPNETEARNASFVFLQNMQIAAMLSYVDGPLVLALEYLRATTDTAIPGVMATATMPGTGPGTLSTSANQIAATLAYFF
jgi:hypothetical protein